MHVVVETGRPVIVLASYPRSGNTFLRQVLREGFGLPSYTQYVDEHQTEHYGGYIGDTVADDAPAVFIKTHDASIDWPHIWHIVRDGRDAITSYREFKNGGHCDLTEWGDKVRRLGDIAKHTTRYEDLVKDPIGEVTKGLQAFGLEVYGQAGELTPFDELQSRDNQFYRRGVVGSHKDEMPDVDEFTRLNHKQLKRFGYL